MLFTDYSDEYGVATELANTRTPNRGDDDDALTELDELRSLLTELGWDAGGLTRADLAEVRALRELVQVVFDAPDNATAAAALNDLMGELGLIPALAPGGQGFHLHLTATGDRLAQRLGAVAVTGLASVLVESGIERFGRCASDTCEDAFVDETKNRSRRYCSDGCANRSGVRAFRARARGS